MLRKNKQVALRITLSGKFKLCDLEKCVCDAVNYRNKTGMEPTSEFLKNYLSLPGVTLSNLLAMPKSWTFRRAFIYPGNEKHSKCFATNLAIA